MSWAHGTTGLGDAGCPSAQSNPACELTLYFAEGSQTEIDFGVPGLESFIDDGWVVVATDYQGLGTPGRHQYTVNRTNAIDAVTIVHAARELPVGAGTKFGVTGWSQGGGAAAASVELNPEDYGDLQIVGAVCMSPGVPFIGLSLPGVGSSLADTEIVPDAHLVMSLVGLATAFPDRLSIDDVLTPVGKRIVDASWNVQGVHHLNDTLARAYAHEGAIIKIDKSKFPQWIESFKEASAALRAPIAPVLVLSDEQIAMGPVPVAWQKGYVTAVEALGGEITTKSFPDDDHFSLPQSSINDAKAFLASKFD